MNKLVVVGLGYVGLPLACLSSKHFEVEGYDIDIGKIDKINQKECPLEDEYAKKLFAECSLNATDNPQVLSNAEIIVICVPTPVDKYHLPDLTPLKSSINTVVEYLKPGQLVIIESTVHPGTMDEIVVPLLEKSGLEAGKDFGVVYCPERIDPGNQKWVLENIPRVLGSLNYTDAVKAKTFYTTFINADVEILNSMKSAEAVKILENTFRDVNIAFINEMAKSFDKMGINLIEVIKGASTKPFGFMPFYPGPGVGGHCIPVDPYYLIEKAKLSGFDHQFLSLARKINRSMPQYVADILQEELNSCGVALSSSYIGVLGCTYKKNIDDIRESPALKIIEILKEKGAKLHIFDPYVRKQENLDQVLHNADYLVLLTDHDEFVHMDLGKLKENNVKLVVDTKNCLDAELIRKMDIRYRGIGNK